MKFFICLLFSFNLFAGALAQQHGQVKSVDGKQVTIQSGKKIFKLDKKKISSSTLVYLSKLKGKKAGLIKFPFNSIEKVESKPSKKFLARKMKWEKRRMKKRK